jgi:hypothetical protein
VLHIASHAAFNPIAPLQSGLYLAADDANDGVLHLDEVYGLNLAATDLVVLSACQTNVGEVSPGDDVLALNRAFLFAGAPTVIASLWNVDDEATSILMTHFYGYLAEGRGKAEALRQAQIDLRAERPEYAHPFYWAAFVLNGIGGETTRPAQVDVGPAGEAETPASPAPAETTAVPPEGRPRTGVCAGAVLPLILVLVVVRRSGRRGRGG